ncbi:MAG: TIGR03936 family radical SAM-associated protein [Gemmatimonadales bacterium]|nr:TIGR03936 family radical SAM-associated protein [Gemmatimonadales bacterium]
MSLTSGSGPWRPDLRFDDPELLGGTLTHRVLPLVTSPGRYAGGEMGLARDGFSSSASNFLLTFPDAYEVGMSHLGLRILLDRLRNQPEVFVDLAFAPWPDMEDRMRREGLPLYGLGSRRSARQFDVVGFSLGYELAYTNVLTMIDLAGSPLLAADRDAGDPVFIGGGSCTLNPTVIGPFLDLLLLGDGEEPIVEAAAVVRQWKTAGGDRADLLAQLRKLPGAWHPGVDLPVRTRVVRDLNDYSPPEQVVPVIEPVHDRLALEVMRGCVRGCRFCQAGMITRPVRERDSDSLIEAAIEGVAGTGYSEVSLLSLSTSDYSGLEETVAGIQDGLSGSHTNLVLPSLRVDSVSEDLFGRISRERPAKFTFAPEAGSQRLREVINKQISDEEILQTAKQAFDSGVKGIKLYFMIGLPTETGEDLDDIVAMVGRILALAPRGGSQIHVSISPFAPKAHTPFQWAGQISRAEIERRNHYLGKRLQRLRVKVSLRDPEVSFLEAVLGLGDDRLASVLQQVWQQGGRFDGWSEHFSFVRWQEAFTQAGVDAEEYVAERDPLAPLPWDSVDTGLSRSFLQEDWDTAQEELTLADCRLDGPCYDCAVCDGGLKHIAARPQPGVQGKVAETRIEDTQSTCGGAGEPGAVFDLRNSDPTDPARELRKWQIWRQQAAAKCWYRLEFTKADDIVWLGHLDLQRQLQLALQRSGLPVAYSKGYHPHPLLKFGPPLPVGVVGLRETLDLALEHQVPGLVEKLNEVLPAGLVVGQGLVVGTQTPPSIDKYIRRFEYRVELPGPSRGGPDRGTVTSAVDAFLASESWICMRKRPKGDIELDARALVPFGGLVLEDEFAGDDGCILRINLLRSKNGGSLPVHDFLTALLGEVLAEPRYCVITRLGYSGQSTDGRWITPLEEVGEISRQFWLSRHMVG